MELQTREKIAIRCLLVAARMLAGYADKETKERIDAIAESLKHLPQKER